MFEEVDNRCPLGFKNQNQPFLFNAHQMVYLRSHKLITDDNEFVNGCTWRFSAPFGYNFRFVISQHFPFKTSSLKAVNDRGIVRNLTANHGASESHFYIEGKEITITYHGNEFFHGVLSIVNRISDAATTAINCPLMRLKRKEYLYQSVDKQLWTNMDINATEYPSNARCSLKLRVPWKNQIIVEVIPGNKFSSSLSFFFDNSLHEVRGMQNNIVLQAQKNGLYNSVLWNFEDDGSFQKFGFQITFEEIGLISIKIICENTSFSECSCGISEIIVPCLAHVDYTIMAKKPINSENGTV